MGGSSGGTSLQKILADLHVHTALSPCAGDRATPPSIVSAALERGLQMIAVTDHNSAQNVEAVALCGSRLGLTVIPGLEVSCREEVHLLCLLATVGKALELQRFVYAALPAQENRPEVFGNQWVMDEEGKPLGQCRRLLMAAADIPLAEMVAKVHDLGGLAIASHVDRPSFSLLANLGLVPPDVAFDALEISAATLREEALARFPEIASYPLVTGSDAHEPGEVGTSPTLFLIKKRELREIKMALQGVAGREHLIQ